MTPIYGLTREELKEQLKALGEKPSKAELIFPALYRDDRNGVSERLREKLEESFSFFLPECIAKSSDETAEKYLLRLSDGNAVETVLMKHGFGSNICVSTQVGCNMGCAFCVSGKQKKLRDLTAAEITGQLMHVILREKADISGIAVMGMGEPLDNFDELLRFIGIVTNPKGLAVGIRHITVSTCGIPEKIRALAESGAGVNLAVSVHAPTDALRSALMPINKVYPLKSVIDAAVYYSGRLNRRVTLEYILLEGINDSAECARELAALVKGTRLYINLIRYNAGADGFKGTTDEALLAFYDILKKNGASVTVRRSLGGSINAACGQLRANRDTSDRGGAPDPERDISDRGSAPDPAHFSEKSGGKAIPKQCRCSQSG